MNTPTPNQANPYAPPGADVRDIADPNAASELAGRGTRLLALIVDSIIAGVVYGPALGPLMMGRVRHPDLGFIPSDISGGGGIISGLLFIVWLIITVRLVSANGQTIGKRLLGIKVVRKDGSKATLGRIFWLRNFVNGIPSAIPTVGGLYALIDSLMIFSDSRQCLHDRIADTIVIRA